MKTQSEEHQIIELNLNHDAFVVVSSFWGSQSPLYRDHIAEQIQNRSDWNSSVSHCPTYGGILFSKKPCGFDLELRDRVTLPIVQRMSAEDELIQLKTLGLHPAHLWTAKEASWKATRHFFQPNTISSMRITFFPEPQGLELNSNFSAQEIVFFRAQVFQIMEDLPMNGVGAERESDYFGACWTMNPCEKSSSLNFSVCFR